MTRFATGSSSFPFVCCLVVALAFPASAADLETADDAWRARDRGAIEERADPVRARELVANHEALLQHSPDGFDRRWRLLRALHFAGDFAASGDNDARRRFDRARQVSEAGMSMLASAVPSPDALSPEAWAKALEKEAGVPRIDLARFFFWSAINWGAWSRSEGLLATVRQGVANRLERYARVAIALEPRYEAGGAYRLLGRLHGALPRVPFVSGWVDRERALPLLDRAFAVDPGHPGNQLLMALTLLDLAPARRSEALDLLDRVGASELRSDMRVEHAAIRREARERRAAEAAPEG